MRSGDTLMNIGTLLGDVGVDDDDDDDVGLWDFFDNLLLSAFNFDLGLYIGVNFPLPLDRSHNEPSS